MTTFDKTRADILIFKTNIRLKKDLTKIATRIRKEPKIKTWNVDVNDIDKVLRIESTDIEVNEIIKIIEQAGYQCEELPD